MEEGRTESVWDYPRPPAVEPTAARIRVVYRQRASGEADGAQPELVVADSRRAVRVLETSHPPTYYIPPQDVSMALLQPSRQPATRCEWKGLASYYDLHIPTSDPHSPPVVAPAVAWTYPHPSAPAFLPLANYIAFYPGRALACFVNDEEVRAQEGSFYGGWITSAISGGPKGIKGGPGTLGW